MRKSWLQATKTAYIGRKAQALGQVTVFDSPSLSGNYGVFARNLADTGILA
jgi:hypothetical protein